MSDWGRSSHTSKGADEQSSRKAPGSHVDPGLCFGGFGQSKLASVQHDGRERPHPRSPVQPGRSNTPYFLAAVIAAVAVWGFQQARIQDLNPASNPTQGASAAARSPVKGEVRTLFSDDDYPAGALQRGEQGTVRAELSIDRRGRVSRCSIAQSSGFDSLD